MRIEALAFIFLALIVGKALIYLEGEQEVELPAFDEATNEFIGLDDLNFSDVGGLDAIADALHNIGQVAVFIGQNALALFELIFDAIVFTVEWGIFVTSLTFQELPGVPWWVNLIILTPFIIAILFKVFTRGQE